MPACLLIRLKRFYKLKNIPKHLLTKTSLLILEEISVEFIPHIQKFLHFCGFYPFAHKINHVMTGLMSTAIIYLIYISTFCLQLIIFEVSSTCDTKQGKVFTLPERPRIFPISMSAICAIFLPVTSKKGMPPATF